MKNFVEKTIGDIQTVFADLFYSEEMARRKGLFQRLDPRVKMFSVLSLITAVNFCKTIPALILMIGYVMILAVGSRVPLARYLWRVSVVSVIFTGTIALPSIFNIVRPGEPFWLITEHLYITKPGLSGAGMLILRSFGSVSLIYLWTATTPWAEILKSLSVLKIPAPFVATLEMAHRYIFLGLEVAANLFTARKSRSLGKSAGKDDRRFVAGIMGHLFIRTTMLGEEVYQAMLSRGYSGEMKTISQFRISLADYRWMIFNIVLFISAIVLKIF